MFVWLEPTRQPQLSKNRINCIHNPTNINIIHRRRSKATAHATSRNTRSSCGCVAHPALVIRHKQDAIKGNREFVHLTESNFKGGKHRASLASYVCIQYTVCRICMYVCIHCMYMCSGIRLCASNGDGRARNHYFHTTHSNVLVHTDARANCAATAAAVIVHCICTNVSR